eukprot:COSAG02_NODE_5593_length_4202_cov_1.591031_1_plen_579_part_10
MLCLGGLQQIVGIADARIANDAASTEASMMVDLVSKVLCAATCSSADDRGDESVLVGSESVAFRTLRARLLKAVWEATAGTENGLGAFRECLPAVAELAQRPTSVPVGASVEGLLSKIRSLYGCYVTFSPSDFAAPTELARTRKGKGGTGGVTPSDVDEESLKPQSIEEVAQHLAALGLPSTLVAEVTATFEQLEYAPSTWKQRIEDLKPTLPSGWSEHKTDAGKTFYHEASSQESTWDHPGEMTAETVTVFLKNCTQLPEKGILDPVKAEPERLLKEASSSGSGIGSHRAHGRGFRSLGSMGKMIADSEDAVAIYYARLLVAASLKQTNGRTTTDAEQLLSPAAVVAAIRPMFEPHGARLGLRPLMQTARVPVPTLTGLTHDLTGWLSADDRASMVLDELMQTLQTPVLPQAEVVKKEVVKVTPSWDSADTVQTAGSGRMEVSGGTFRLSGGSAYSMCVCRTPLPETGTHTVKVKVHTSSRGGIGVVTSFDQAKSHSNGSKAWIGNGPHGWCLFNDGDCCHNGSWSGGSQSFRAGSTVAITINHSSHTMTVRSGSSERRDVYSGLPTKLYFAVAMHEE